MTYLEAAEKVLRDAGSPLHYREVTERALAEGLIEPKGSTPEATMGAQLYMAVRKAEASGEAGVFRQTGRGHFDLERQQVRGVLDADIDAQNSKVREQLHDFLRDMNPRQLELLVGQLLAALGFEDVAVTRYSGDGGIDVDAVLTVGGVTRVKTAVQVKRWAKKLAGKTVRELRGGLMTDQRGLIITTSSFTKDAVSEADASGKAPISLIDGERFVELLIEEQIGVRKRAVPLLELNVGELVVAEDDQATGDKSGTLWPLPGGKANYFTTLLAFLDHIGSTKPSIDDMTEWVIATYEKVTKTTVVRSYLRSVLYSMGVIDFDGDRVVLTPEGENVRQVRSQEEVLNLLKTKVSGIDETLELLTTEPKDTPEIREHLNRTLGLTWETDHQARFRLEWLAACGAVERAAGSWRLTSPNTPM